MDISAYMDADMWNEITGKVGRPHRNCWDAMMPCCTLSPPPTVLRSSIPPLTTRNARKDWRKLASSTSASSAHGATSHLRVINNHVDFDTKINRVLKEISSTLGLPQPITEERK